MRADGTRLPLVGTGAAGAPAVVVAVHAHPDDESLATGIALAHHAARGDRVHVVTCTLGEEGEVIPPALAHLEGSPELAPYRDGELARAVAELGAEQEYLGGRPPRWRDSGMAGTPSAGHRRAFIGADVAEAASLLAGRLAELAPDVVLTYDKDGGYGHPDHVQAHRVTLAAVRAMPPASRPTVYAVVTPRSWAEEDRAWLRDHVPPGGPTVLAPEAPYPASVVDDALVTHAVVDPAALPAQVAALEQHATQVTVYDGYYALSNEIAARLPGREGYAVLDPETGRLSGKGAGG